MSIFLPDSNWFPQHRNTDVPGLFFGAEQDNNNFLINMYCYVRNVIFREYMEHYWLDSWEIETEEVSTRFIIAGDGSINYTQKINPTVRSVNVRLGKLVYGKRDYDYFHWCGRTSKVEKLFRKSLADRKDDAILSEVTVKGMLDERKKFYYTNISAYNSMSSHCMSAGKRIQEMQLDIHDRDLHFELLHYAHTFRAQGVEEPNQFRSLLINEYKRRRIQCI